jgi:hypothetical protein
MLFYYHGNQDKKEEILADVLLKSSPRKKITDFPVKYEDICKTGLELLTTQQVSHYEEGVC